MPSVTQQKRASAKKKTSSGGISDRIVRLTEVSNDLLRLNIYGRSGTGKTRLWSTFPGRILAMICSGIASSGELKSVLTKHRSKIDMITLNSQEDVKECLSFIRKNSKTYQTVAVDHSTGLHDLNLKEVLGLDELPIEKSWGDASRDQHKEAGMRTKEMLREFLDLPTNVVIIGQERRFESEGSSKGDLDMVPEVAGSLPPAVSQWFNPACDYIVRTYITPRTAEVTEKKLGKQVKKTVKVKGKVDYCLQTSPDGVYTIKVRDQTGKEIPFNIKDPTYEKLMKVIKGE